MTPMFLLPSNQLPAGRSQAEPCAPGSCSILQSALRRQAVLALFSSFSWVSYASLIIRVSLWLVMVQEGVPPEISTWKCLSPSQLLWRSPWGSPDVGRNEHLYLFSLVMGRVERPVVRFLR